MLSVMAVPPPCLENALKALFSLQSMPLFLRTKGGLIFSSTQQPQKVPSDAHLSMMKGMVGIAYMIDNGGRWEGRRGPWLCTRAHGPVGASATAWLWIPTLHVSLLSRVNLRQSDRTGRTVWDLWPHSLLLLFANLRPDKKARRPIFPVLICVIRAVSGFLIALCSCRTLVPGVRARARSSFFFDSATHDSAHLLSICCLCTALIAALRGGTKTIGAVLLVSLWLFRCFLSLHPVDSFAALSAFSFPSSPE